MGKQTTRDAALSRLFGNTDEGPVGDSAPADTQMESASSGHVDSVELPKALPPPRREGRGAGAPAAPVTPEAVPDASGYIGLGKYARADGVVERITPYVRPDQAEALRVAVARKSDPRGRDISQIIQSLLDEAGYRL